MITLDLRPSSSNDFNIYQTTTLPRCLLVMDLVKTCRADGCCKRLVWLAGGFRPSSHEVACGSDKLLLFFSPRWSLPLDHLCLRRNSRISWWNSAFTINHIFFASSHNKYPLSLAWSQHWSNMSCANKWHPDVSIVVIRLLEYRFSNVSKHRPSARSWKGLMGEGFINPTVPTQWLWVGWFLT